MVQMELRYRRVLLHTAHLFFFFFKLLSHLTQGLCKFGALKNEKYCVYRVATNSLALNEFKGFWSRGNEEHRVLTVTLSCIGIYMCVGTRILELGDNDTRLTGISSRKPYVSWYTFNVCSRVMSWCKLPACRCTAPHRDDEHTPRIIFWRGSIGIIFVPKV